MKYKSGDKVRVSPSSTFNIGMSAEMQKYRGQIVTIYEISSDGDNCTIEQDSLSHLWTELMFEDVEPEPEVELLCTLSRKNYCGHRYDDGTCGLKCYSSYAYCSFRLKAKGGK